MTPSTHLHISFRPLLQIAAGGRFLLLIAAGGLFLGGFSSCHKQNNSAPSITRIRADLPAPNDSTLSFVNPGQYVVLEGNGLTSAQQILFDGVPATYNSAITANNSLVIPVPSIAFSTVDSSKVNTIEIIYSSGTLIYHFPVVPPPPVVNSISNEFAHPGDVITIKGQYLFLIESITFPGGVPATQYSSTTDGTTLTVTVPASATTGGAISIVTTGGTGLSLPAAGFNDPRGMLCNFDDVNSYSWGAAGIIDSTTFTGNRGYFAQLSCSGINAGDLGWYNGGRSINLNAVQWIASDSISNPIGDYALKFEVFVKVPWVVGSIYIVPNYTWTYLADYAPWKANADSTYVNAGQWQTVVIPLTAFQTNDGAGTPPASLSAFLGSGNQSMSLMFVNDGAKPVTQFDAGVDNIRVVKIQ